MLIVPYPLHIITFFFCMVFKKSFQREKSNNNKIKKWDSATLTLKVPDSYRFYLLLNLFPSTTVATSLIQALILSLLDDGTSSSNGLQPCLAPSGLFPTLQPEKAAQSTVLIKISHCFTSTQERKTEVLTRLPRPHTAWPCLRLQLGPLSAPSLLLHCFFLQLCFLCGQFSVPSPPMPPPPPDQTSLPLGTLLLSLKLGQFLLIIIFTASRTSTCGICMAVLLH